MASQLFESLENRTLMSTTLHVTSVTADNRGEIFVQLSGAADSTTVNKNSVQVYTAGHDNILGNADDTRVPASVRYSASTDRITILAQTGGAGIGYRVKVVGSRMKAQDESLFDGEFDGAFPAGNGVPGGNFEFQTKNDKSASPKVRMSTTAGVITIALDETDTPKTAKNFLAYVNSGLYDGTIFHRDGRTDNVNGPINIIQGGGYTGTAVDGQGNPLDAIATFAPISLEAGLDNARGTIAMARTSDPNSATSQFFFNTEENSFLNPSGPNNPGYAVFGSVNASSLAVIDAIFNASTVAPNSTFNTVPQLNGQNVVVARAAVLMKVATL